MGPPGAPFRLGPGAKCPSCPPHLWAALAIIYLWSISMATNDFPRDHSLSVVLVRTLIAVIQNLIAKCKVG